MSLYQVDKAMRQIAIDDAAREAFLKDRACFLEGRDLTHEERKALSEIDYPTLYRLGAHSFLLYRFVRRVLPGDQKSLEAEYCKNVAPFGRPDYST